MRSNWGENTLLIDLVARPWLDETDGRDAIGLVSATLQPIEPLPALE